MADVRPIDANALLLDIENEKKNSYCAAEAEAFDIAWDAIYEAPTIDPWHPASEVPPLHHVVDDNGVDVYEFDGSEEMIVKLDDGRNVRASYVIDNYGNIGWVEEEYGGSIKNAAYWMAIPALRKEKANENPDRV